ncbi:MAG: SGNH/GDSL hydrolase family protein [Magnetococcales bacterium]|nr:SGNH/GDSL hydrolase family protein [Magnetococcales bacterium]MBF0321344.1 SGNH/GDSL hydrolase family protein [Magnetococcales bacterium]
MNLRRLFASMATVIVTLLVSALVGEGLVRIKNANQKSYTIEMWRYARELKQMDPELGHIHQRGKSSLLQNIPISINSLGMRGPELQSDARPRILLLGSSITLAWGVPEEKGSRAQLERHLGGTHQVLNAAVGNFNLPRYIRLFERDLRQIIKPKIVVIDYFIDDAKPMDSASGNWIMRHSEFAVTLYYIASKLLYGSRDLRSLKEHYDAIYDDSSETFLSLKDAMEQMNQMSHDDGFKVILALIPDVHQLTHYPFAHIHAKMCQQARSLGWTCADFLDDLGKFSGPDLWTIPGDPHPNATAHAIMAERLAKVIKGL